MTGGAWTGAHSRYVAIETAIGVAITIVLSCAFAALVFGRSLPVAAADPALQIDAALQAFMIALMGSLVPTAITRRRFRSGVVAGVARPHRWPSGLIARSVAIALAVATPAALLHLIVMTRLPEVTLDLIELLVFKSGFGVAVALIATPVAVVLALRDGQAL